MTARRTAWRVAAGVSGALLTVLAAGCTTTAAPIGPSAVSPTVPTVVAVLHRDGLLLKAHRLQDARQIEGIIEWVPESVWYKSFEEGRWWFATPDWEWMMVPHQGRVYFGVRRLEPLSGDGTLGMIRFEAEPAIRAVKVWVDGNPVQAESEDRRTERAPVTGILPTEGTTSRAQGRAIGGRWFVVGGAPGGN